MIPGSNILGAALSLIGRQTFEYFAFQNRRTNNVGLDIAVYAPPRKLSGSVQPVPRSLYQQNGLDFQSNYVNFYVSKSVLDVTRDISGDQIAFSGNHYQCLSKTDWFAQDGWVAMLAVQIPNSPS